MTPNDHTPQRMETVESDSSTTTPTTAAVYQRRNHSFNDHNTNTNTNSHMNRHSNHNHNNSSNNDNNNNITVKEKFSRATSTFTFTKLKWFHNHYFYFKKNTNTIHSKSQLSSSVTIPTVTTGTQLQQQPPPPHNYYPTTTNNHTNMIRRTTISIAGLCLLYIYVLYRTQYVLEKHEQYVYDSRHQFTVRRRQPSDAKKQMMMNQEKKKKKSIPLSQVHNRIPISPMDMIRHPQEIQQLVQQLQPPLPLPFDPNRGRPHERILGVPKQHHQHHNNNKTTTTKIKRTPSTTATTTTTTSHSREPKAYLQYLQHQALQRKQTNHWTTSSSSTTTSSSSSTMITDTDSFIIYNADIPGQGTGNLMAGLLAAHLLGDEFHRIVCINPYYGNSDFSMAFESIDPIAKTKCPILLQQQKHSKRLSRTGMADISLINFEGAADECALQNIMSNHIHHKVVYLVANTYPRWPTVPDYYFLYYYQPTTTLYKALPYQIQPTTVVHLRQPDDYSDVRDGLDTDSLQALEQLLPANASTFLVTNNVDFYHRFSECCHWSHPQWNVVQHSALSYIWGTGTGREQFKLQQGAMENNPKMAQTKSKKQHLQMWVDWYTVLMADDVYHTHSDFSISAIHWMNKKNHSFSIRGYNTQTSQLETRMESWWVDGETIPLVHRTVQGEPGTTNELRACTSETLQKSKQQQQRQRHQRLLQGQHQRQHQ